MPRTPLSRARLLSTLAAAGIALAGADAAQAAGDAGAVYTQTNSAAGNAIEAFDRAADGRLTHAGSFPTGGRGSGSGLGSQGAVALSDDGRLLFAVDAGSAEVSTFRVTRDGLKLAGRAPSGGELPVSVTSRGDTAYVLNAGGAPNVSGLDVARDGSITPKPGSTEALPAGAAGPAQVAFSPKGDRLVVTEKATNRIDGFPLDTAGLPEQPVITDSAGATPFGFGFGHRGNLIVSEAGASTVSSYRTGPSGTLAVVTPSALTHQGAACWIAVTGNGRYAYSANASTGSISGFAIGHDGSLSELNADGRTASAPSPNDEAFSPDSRYLYVVNPRAQQITVYRTGSDGSLRALPAAGGLPAGTVGLAAR